MAQPKDLTVELGMDMVRYFQRNPVIAANKLLIRNGTPVILPPHERIVLKSLWQGVPFNLIIMSRGCAKTFINALYLTLRGMLFPDERLGIASASYRQAQFVFDEVIRFWDESPMLKECCIKEPVKGPNECNLLYRGNRSFVKAMPLGDGSKIRGARFNRLFLDEVAQVPPDIINTALLPMLNVRSNPMGKLEMQGNNQLIMSSTAYYQFNHLYTKFRDFERAADEGNKDYNLQMWDFRDTPPGFMDEKILAYAKRTLPRLVYLMEYENVFPADSDGWYPASLLAQAQTSNVSIEPRGKDGYEYVLGIDPAREQANFAIVVIRLGSDYNRVVRVHTLKKFTWPDAVKAVRQFLKMYNVVRIALDKGGGGGTVRDLLAEDTVYVSGSKSEQAEMILPIDRREFPNRRGRRILDVVDFQNKIIHQMNHDLKAELENGDVKLPQVPLHGDEGEILGIYHEIEQMLEETRNIIAIPLRNGFMSFTTPNKRMNKDRYSAFLLAAKAARDYGRSLADGEERPVLVSGGWAPTFFMGGTGW